MKWLFVTTQFPWPLAHGTTLRVYHLSRTLAGAGDDVAVLAPGGDAEGAEAYASAGVTLLDVPASAAGAAGDSAGPYAYDPAVAEAVGRHAGRYDVAVLVRPATLAYAHQARGAGRVVADFIDDPVLEAARRLRPTVHLRRLGQQLVFIARQRRCEREWLAGVDLATFVSEADAASFARRRRQCPVAVVPNGVEVSHFARPASPAPSAGGPPAVTFLGNLSHPPNTDAALWLLRRIAPRIWKRRPETRIVIAGACPPPAVRAAAGPRVVVTGWMEDVRPTLWDATVVMLPMRLGTGIKNKLLEAWAAGAPVVATGRACQGTPAADGEDLLVADSAAALAAAAVRVIAEEPLRRRLAGAGADTVRQHLTWSAAAAGLRRTVADLRRTLPSAAATVCRPA